MIHRYINASILNLQYQSHIETLYITGLAETVRLLYFGQASFSQGKNKSPFLQMVST